MAANSVGPAWAKVCAALLTHSNLTTPICTIIERYLEITLMHP